MCAIRCALQTMGLPMNSGNVSTPATPSYHEHICADSVEVVRMATTISRDMFKT